MRPDRARTLFSLADCGRFEVRNFMTVFPCSQRSVFKSLMVQGEQWRWPSSNDHSALSHFISKSQSSHLHLPSNGRRRTGTSR